MRNFNLPSAEISIYLPSMRFQFTVHEISIYRLSMGFQLTVHHERFQFTVRVQYGISIYRPSWEISIYRPSMGFQFTVHHERFQFTVHHKRLQFTARVWDFNLPSEYEISIYRSIMGFQSEACVVHNVRCSTPFHITGGPRKKAAKRKGAKPVPKAKPKRRKWRRHEEMSYSLIMFWLFSNFVRSNGKCNSLDGKLK